MMARYIDANALYERTAEWEAQALHEVERHMTDEDDREWRRWSTILTERSAFKFDVADAPTADVVPTEFHERCLSIEIGKRWNMVDVVRCKDCKEYQTPYCPLCHVYKVEDDDYCSYGERKPNDN